MKGKHQACLEAIDFVNSIKRKITNSYAQSYIDALPESFQLYGADGVRTQLQYILSNTSGWRGIEAQQAKLKIKGFIKELKDE